MSMRAGFLTMCILLGSQFTAFAQAPSPIGQTGSDARVEFEIPPQSLTGALNEFAAKTSLQVSYPADLTAGLTSPGLSGSHNLTDALEALLAGTGLGFRFANNQTVTLERGAPVPAAPAVIPQHDPSPSSPPSPGRQKPVKVPEIVVKDVRERDDDSKSYVAEEASTAMRTDTPIRDTPQSIQVITRKVIEEQRAIRLDTALQNVSGIFSSALNHDVNDDWYIRGFNANNNNIVRNGLFDPNSAQTASDPYNIQRLEVLKGPSSVLYGLGDPGGIINIVTRKPQAEAAYSAHVTLGNFHFYRSELDATGPLNAAKTLLYRLTVVGQKAGSFMDYANRDIMGVTPSFTWLMGHRTTLTVDAEYFKRWTQRIPGLPVQGTVLPNINGEIPRNRFTGMGDFGYNNRTLYRVGYDLNHNLNNNWSVRNMYRYSIQEIDQANGGALGLDTDQRTLSRFWGGTESSLSRSHIHSMVTNVIGHFKLFEMDHTLLTGVELREQRYNPIQSIQRERSTYDMDLFAPDYSLNPYNAPVLSNNRFEQAQRVVGAYLQDQVALLPNLKFVGAVRFDYVHQWGRNGPYASNPPERNSDDTGVSPRLGLVYQPIEPISLYTSWMRGFLPNDPGAFNPGGALFEPQRSTQYEVGIKTYFLQKRLSATLAWYHLTRENLLTPNPDPALALQGFQVQTGEERSQGIEFDITASLAAGWNVIASYTYTDAEVTKDNNVEILNKRLGMIPYNKATLWSTYYVQDGALKGFGFGGGVIGYSNRNASIFGPGQVEVPGFVLVNTALYYNRDLQPGNWVGAKQLNVALNIHNLFDQRYVAVAYNTTSSFFFGDPRTVMATVGLRF